MLFLKIYLFAFITVVYFVFIGVLWRNILKFLQDYIILYFHFLFLYYILIFLYYAFILYYFYFLLLCFYIIFLQEIL